METHCHNVDTFPSNSHILVIGRSMVIRSYIQNHLRALGYHRILECSNGQEAVEILNVHFEKDLKIDLIISDEYEPNVTGIGFLATLKAHPFYREISTLIILAERDITQIIHIFFLGSDGILIKPFNETHLSEELSLIWIRRH